MGNLEVSDSYRIIDEPEPNRLSQWAVDPLWPFLAVMLGGAGIGLLWFAFNAVALGSGSRSKELTLAAASFVGAMALTLLGFYLVNRDVLTVDNLPYWAIVLVVYKVGLAYFIHLSQARSSELFTYFGGRLKSGMLVLFAAILLRGVWISVVDSTFWILVLG